MSQHIKSNQFNSIQFNSIQFKSNTPEKKHTKPLYKLLFMKHKRTTSKAFQSVKNLSQATHATNIKNPTKNIQIEIYVKNLSKRKKQNKTNKHLTAKSIHVSKARYLFVSKQNIKKQIQTKDCRLQCLNILVVVCQTCNIILYQIAFVFYFHYIANYVTLFILYSYFFFFTSLLLKNLATKNTLQHINKHKSSLMNKKTNIIHSNHI